MTTNTEESESLTVADRIVIGVAVGAVCTLLGSILLPGPGTVIGAKIGALLGGGSAS